MLKQHLLSSWICLAELKPQFEHFNLSRHVWQTFSLSRITGKHSKTFSMAFVMGILSAQAILRKVRDILWTFPACMPSVYLLSCIWSYRFPKKSEGGVRLYLSRDPYSHRSCIGSRWRYFGLKFDYDNDGMDGGQALVG